MHGHDDDSNEVTEMIVIRSTLCLTSCGNSCEMVGMVKDNNRKYGVGSLLHSSDHLILLRISMIR